MQRGNTLFRLPLTVVITVVYRGHGSQKYPHMGIVFTPVPGLQVSLVDVPFYDSCDAAIPLLVSR